ncbi:pentapeptide repeat-containing protein [Roseibium sp. MMSF_3412]|uniref:pentapeptide repeat-containing protein n=1 Tax=Roseibium sp. MMSF_3412 TaxID=3046712 RepID=UPI00273E68AF|nr:pentapeptide repeat-containing protein [Roseibium sp. MMSF_3412]
MSAITLLSRPHLPRMSNPKRFISVLVAVLAGLLIAGFTIFRVGWKDWSSDVVPIASANLAGASLTPRPENWASHQDAMLAFFYEWCARPDTDKCPSSAAQRDALFFKPDLRREFAAKRKAFIQSLPKSSLENLDLRNANLSGSFLVGADMRNIRFGGAQFFDAVLDSAVIDGTAAEPVSFENADLSNADISIYEAPHAIFNQAKLSDGTYYFGQLDFGNFVAAKVEHSQFGGIIRDGHFLGASFRNSKLSGLITGFFSDGSSDRLDFRGADLTYLNLVFSAITPKNKTDTFEDAALVGSVDADVSGWAAVSFSGSALRNVDLARTRPFQGSPQFFTESWEFALRNSFGDASVSLPDGVDRPCQWSDKTLSEGEFLGAWRAWLERADQKWPPFTTSSLPARSIEAAENGEERIYTITSIPARNDLLPPVEQCPWFIDPDNIVVEPEIPGGE